MKEEITYINGIRVVKVISEPMDAINIFAEAKKSRERIEESQRTGKALSKKKKEEILRKFEEQFGSKNIISAI